MARTAQGIWQVPEELNLQLRGHVMCYSRAFVGRSMELKMRYTTLVGDGDTKTFNGLKQDEPYGPDYIVEKEECVNHVAKRLNTGLWNLKKTLGNKSIKIGGNAKGSLTDVSIYFNLYIV